MVLDLTNITQILNQIPDILTPISYILVASAEVAVYGAVIGLIIGIVYYVKNYLRFLDIIEKKVKQIRENKL